MPAETPLWPKALLLGSSVLYGTNFALGRLMTTRCRHASTSPAGAGAVALFPFLLRLAPNLRKDASDLWLLHRAGLRDARFSISRSAGRHGGLRQGALTVVVCPTCAFLVDPADASVSRGPARSVRRYFGLGRAARFLELPSVLAGGGDAVGEGDRVAVLQAVGFGTSSSTCTESHDAEGADSRHGLLSTTRLAQVSVRRIYLGRLGVLCARRIGPFDGGWLLGRYVAQPAPAGCSWTRASDRLARGAPAWTGLVQL